jgi:aspartate aminotransferase
MTIKLAELTRILSPSPTLAISALAATMQAEGKDVVSFSAGQPDFDTPEHVKVATRKALDEGKNGYQAVEGIKPLREAIAQKYKNRGLDVSFQNVVVSNGGKFSLFLLMQVLLDQGDEVIIPAPYWVSYPEQVKLNRATPVIIEATEAHDFKITAAQLEAAITPKTKLLILNTPSNPTGAVYSREDLLPIAEVCLKHKLTVVYDAIYDQLVYDGAEAPEFAVLLPGLEALTITVNGLSKSHAMTGWRVGYMVAPKHVAQAVADLQSQSTSGITSFIQWGCVEAVRGTQEPTLMMRESFDRRRKLIVGLLREISGVTCNMPTGAFYAFPNLSAFLGRTAPDGTVIHTDMDLTQYLLKQHLVALVPGSSFGAPGFMRLSYATSDANITKGVARMAQGLALLK